LALVHIRLDADHTVADQVATNYPKHAANPDSSLPRRG
jgi:hypothetical protein